MASQGVANQGRRPTTKIHTIRASWNVNQSNISRSNGTELFLKEKPQTEIEAKPDVKTELKNGTLPHISLRKLRERLVHLLAVNSYTRQEINSILHKEGLRPCERQTVVYVLKDVAQPSHNVYSLRRNIWKEVDEKWPYYNEKELQQLKRRKEQSLRSTNSSIVLTPESNESHLLRTNKEQSLIELTPESNENNSPKKENTSKRENLDNVEPQQVKKRRIEHSIFDSHTTSQPANTKTNLNTIESPKHDFGNYTEITNFEQRQQYAAEFAQYHAEYMPLFQQTTELRNSFRELGAQSLNMSKECAEYETISERIVATFLFLNSEGQLHREERVRYLHAKLAHIKRLITLFDSKRTKEIAMAYATAMAKKYELRYERLKGISDNEKVLGTTKPITIWHKGGAAATTDEEIPLAKQKYISDFLGKDLALSDSSSDDD
uniref:RNA polymerase II elongation factor ELL2 n=1 Tax=Bactrocera latifrons TaxID=174628 RepID=A0A0K8TZ15_BACLA